MAQHDDSFENPMEEYEAIMNLERIFLDKVGDDELRGLYLSAKGRDEAAFRALVEIAARGWSRGRLEQVELREAKADRAIEILYMIRKSLQ